MEDKAVSTFTKVHTSVSFVVMILVNALANIIPFNGMTTGQVSDSYPNLFAPAPITFSIWGVIYLMLVGYLVYQFGVFKKKDGSFNKALIEKTGILFTITSIANTAWMFVWHYKAIEVSLALMAVILVCLIIINMKITKTELSKREKLFIKLPFSIYFGWITVATIANATALLVSMDWNRFGIPETVWTMIILVVGLAIGALTMFRNKDLGYGLVIIWAYIGILIKHLSDSGFGGKYPLIIIVLIVCIIVLLITEVYIIVKSREKAKSIVEN